MTGFVLGFFPLVGLMIRQDPTPLFSTDWEALAGLVVLLVPLSFAYAIIQHRLFDLRLVIRRSLRYALAKHVLFAAFVSPVAIVVVDIIADHQNFIRQYLQAEFPQISLLIVIAAAMVTLRRPLMNWLDRRFFREAYDARKILSHLAGEIPLKVNEDELTSLVLNKINDSLHVKYSALMLRGTERGDYRCAQYLGETPCAVVVPYGSRLVRELQRRPWRPLEMRAADAEEWLRALPPETASFFVDARIDLVIPLRLSRQNIIGFMLLGEKQSEEPYSKEDTELLMTVAAQTAVGVERARLSAEMAKEETLKREVEIAQEVQARLFPQSLPHLTSLDVAGVCRPAQGVAGDYYDFLPLAPGRLGIAVGDIAGKGISAALLMANLQALLRSQATLAGDEVARLIGSINTFLFNSTSHNKFATLFYATYDQTSRRLTYVNAGHNSPLLVRGTSRRSTGIGHSTGRMMPTTDGSLALATDMETQAQLQRLETGGIIVGAFETATFEQETIHLDPGDLIVAYTDGVIEAHSPEGDIFGEQRLEELILSKRHLSAAELINTVLQSVADFTRGAVQHDDVTLIVMKVL
jgi:sigma-B regulation protein RsbU (phosphoserine phosphatase)